MFSWQQTTLFANIDHYPKCLEGNDTFTIDGQNSGRWDNEIETEKFCSK